MSGVAADGQFQVREWGNSNEQASFLLYNLEFCHVCVNGVVNN